MITWRSSLVEQADAFEHVDVRARSGEVVGREPAVEGQADGEREQLVGRTFAEPTVPERLPGRLALCPARSRRPGPWRRDHVCAERPHSRTNPSESCVAERVLGVVGREVVVVEAARRAPADRAQRPASSRSRTSPVTSRLRVGRRTPASARISGECHKPS